MQVKVSACLFEHHGIKVNTRVNFSFYIFVISKVNGVSFYLMTNLTQILFYICLFQFSTYFEHSSAHHQEFQFYQYDIWYMSLYVGDRLECYRIDIIESPDDEHLNARNM